MMFISDAAGMPERPAELNNFRYVLELDREDVLYGRRYECFGLEKDKWYAYNLESFFVFLDGLMWLHKEDVYAEI